MVVILRLWLQLVRADFYNPFSQFTITATQPVVGPLRRLIPSIGALDTATLVFGYFIVLLKIFVIYGISSQSLPPIPTAFFAALVSLVYEVMWLIFWITVIRALLSWVSQGNMPVERVMIQLTDPIMGPIRRLIPPMGGLDLSVLIFLLAWQFIINLYKSGFGQLIVP